MTAIAAPQIHSKCHYTTSCKCAQCMVTKYKEAQRDLH
jgi:hypothetical protein